MSDTILSGNFWVRYGSSISQENNEFLHCRSIVKLVKNDSPLPIMFKVKVSRDDVEESSKI